MLSLLIPPLTPSLLLSSPRDHLSLLTALLLSPIPQACHSNVSASIVVPISLPSPSLSPIHRMRCLLLFLRRCLHPCRWFRGPVSERLLIFGLFSSYLSGDDFHLWLLGLLVYPILFRIDTVENIWGVNWIPREFTRNIQYFGLSSICVVCYINKTQRIQH